MKVLVTGHRGYIGAVLVPMLLERGHYVHGLDSELFEGCDYGDFPELVPATRKDVRDVELVDVMGFDAVLHLAGLSNDPLGNLAPSITDDINHKASVHVARLSKEAGVKRFVFSSSCSTYGAAGDKMIDEGAAFNPVTPYGRSKVDAEMGISALADEAFCPVYLRNATAYGLCPRLRFDLVVNNLTAWAYTTGKVLLKSDGMPWRPIVHIEDISRAFIAALEAPDQTVYNTAFNIGRTAENFRIREIADMVHSKVEGSVVSYADSAGPDTRTYQVSFVKAETELPGYSPKWTLPEGIAQLLAGFAQQGLKPDEFEDARYSRIASLKARIASGMISTDLRRITNLETV